MEIVTLLVPGFNDSEDEIREAASFLASLSPDIPWHVTAFHKDYKMADPDNTPAETLMKAAKTGYDAVGAAQQPPLAVDEGKAEGDLCPVGVHPHRNGSPSKSDIRERLGSDFGNTCGIPSGPNSKSAFL